MNNGDTKKELLKYTKCSIAEKYLIYLIPNYSHLCIDIVLGSCLSVKDIPKSTKYSPSLQEKQNYYKIDQGYTDYQQPYLELSVWTPVVQQIWNSQLFFGASIIYRLASDLCGCSLDLSMVITPHFCQVKGGYKAMGRENCQVISAIYIVSPYRCEQFDVTYLDSISK